MTRLFILICLMTMVSSVGMASQNLSDHADLPRRLDRFRHVVATINRLRDIPQRSLEEEQMLEDAGQTYVLRWMAGAYCETRSYPVTSTEQELIDQFIRGQRIRILREIEGENFRP